MCEVLGSNPGTVWGGWGWGEPGDGGSGPHSFPSVSLLGTAASRLILGGGAWARRLPENRLLVLSCPTSGADGGLPSFVTLAAGPEASVTFTSPNSTTSGEQSQVLSLSLQRLASALELEQRPLRFSHQPSLPITCWAPAISQLLGRVMAVSCPWVTSSLPCPRDSICSYRPGPGPAVCLPLVQAGSS